MRDDEARLTRTLQRADTAAVRRILETSEYVHVRFEPEELPDLLDTYPAAGVFTRPPGPLGRVAAGTLQAFLLVNWLVPPSAWIGGFGVTWSAGEHYTDFLDAPLAQIIPLVRARGARTLYYSGNDLEADWLRGSLEARGFALVTVLRSYDKIGFVIPSAGNRLVRVRPFTPVDAAEVVAVECEAFAELWRHDAAGFLEVARHYPYFVVAEDASGIVGYQFNTLGGDTGYLVRIAVHPRAAGQGVGTRLMAEAVGYFARARVARIALNAEERNTRAHALYEWFGFQRVPPRGFVLGRDLATSAP